MMGFGQGGALMRRRMMQPQMPADMTPLMAEVMRLQPMPMPQPPQFGGGLAAGLMGGAQRLMQMRDMMQPPQASAAPGTAPIIPVQAQPLPPPGTGPEGGGFWAWLRRGLMPGSVGF